jgi:adenine-specific DNA-methyltransferase
MSAPLGFVRQISALQRITRPGSARTVALALLKRLSKHFAPKLEMPRYRCRTDARASKLVEWIGDFLVKKPFDEAAYYLSCVYAVLCEQKRRREFAMYFTPPALARHIVDSVALETTSFTKLRFVDPACGGAAFLLPTIVKLRNMLRKQRVSPKEIVSAVNRQIFGIERDAVLAELAQQFMRIALAEELGDRRLRLDQLVRVGNALDLFSKEEIPLVDVVLCNPPYRKIGAHELRWFRRHFDGVISGQPNLYAMFMRAAMDMIAPGGLVALLTPTSYFSGPTFQPIRAHYVRSFSIQRIDLLHERDNLFLGVEHDVAALLARRRLLQPAQQNPEVFGWNELLGETSFGEISLSKDGDPWHLPRDEATARALNMSKATTSSLADYGYKVRVGVYVWNRDKRPTRKRRPKRSCDRNRSVPVIWATQIGQDGVFRFVSRSPKEKRARYILLRKDDRRGVVERDSVVLQRTSSRGQRRRLVAATLPRGFAKKLGGFVGENHVIILEPTSGRPAVPRKILARLLNSEFIRDLYSTTTGTTAVTTEGLNALPLPDPRALEGLLSDPRGMEQAIRAALGLAPVSKEANRANAKASPI